MKKIINVEMTDTEATAIVREYLANTFRDDKGCGSTEVTVRIINTTCNNSRIPVIEHPLHPNAMDMLDQGNKIGAIKIVREAYGFDLKKAKDYVEHWLYITGRGPQPLY